MSTTITVPQGFQYVAASLLSTVVVLFGQNIAVGVWRKKSGIKYPQLYAEKAEVAASKDALIFNCAQRAHANTLENIPIIYLTTLLTSLKFPIFAAFACGLWSLSRVAYTRGYLTGDPAKRVGAFHRVGGLAMLGLLATSLYAVGDLVISRLR